MCARLLSAVLHEDVQSSCTVWQTTIAALQPAGPLLQYPLPDPLPEEDDVSASNDGSTNVCSSASSGSVWSRASWEFSSANSSCSSARASSSASVSQSPAEDSAELPAPPAGAPPLAARRGRIRVYPPVSLEELSIVGNFQATVQRLQPSGMVGFM